MQLCVCSTRGDIRTVSKSSHTRQFVLVPCRLNGPHCYCPSIKRGMSVWKCTHSALYKENVSVYSIHEHIRQNKLSFIVTYICSSVWKNPPAATVCLWDIQAVVNLLISYCLYVNFMLICEKCALKMQRMHPGVLFCLTLCWRGERTHWNSS